MRRRALLARSCGGTANSKRNRLTRLLNYSTNKLHPAAVLAGRIAALAGTCSKVGGSTGLWRRLHTPGPLVACRELTCRTTVSAVFTSAGHLARGCARPRGRARGAAAHHGSGAVSRRPCACRQRPQPVCDCAAPASAAVKPALYSMPTWRPPASAGRPRRPACLGCRPAAHAALTPRAISPAAPRQRAAQWSRALQAHRSAQARALGRAAGRTSRRPAHATVTLTRLACFPEKGDRQGAAGRARAPQTWRTRRGRRRSCRPGAGRPRARRAARAGCAPARAAR
jgi:hypothetical protein